MPIVNTYLSPGDPRVQVSGEYRGTINFEFTGGRVVSRFIRAPDQAAWDARLLAIGDQVQAKKEEQDAAEAVSADTVIGATGEASIEQRAVAYLRAAWREESPYMAYLLFDKFNDFRIAKGWNLNQVAAGLASAGLTTEEWDDMLLAYQYLSGSGRPTTMAAFQTIQNAWDGR